MPWNTRTGGVSIGSRHSPLGGFERHLSWVIPAALAVVLATAYLAIPSFRTFVHDMLDVMSTGDLERIRSWLRGFGPWSLVVIVFILTVQPLLVVVPSALMMVVAVLAYGPWWGGLLAWGGSILAAVVGYAFGWALNPVTVDRLIGREVERRIERHVKRYGFWAVALFRVSPVLSTDAISIVAGLLEMHFWRYLAATALGFLPLAAGIAILGGDLVHMERTLVWVSVASIGALLLYVAIDRWRRRAE